LTYRTSLEPKRAAEKIEAVFDFSTQVAVGETVDSATTVSTLYSGTDAAPGDVVSGATSISGGQVTQLLIGGVAGNVYLITCTAVTDAPETLIRTAYLVVI